MIHKIRRVLPWLTFSLILILLLAACGPAGGTAGFEEAAEIPASESEAEPEAGDSAQSDGSEASAEIEEEADPTEVEEEMMITEDGMMLTDNRSERLRLLTQSWGTNWERHTIRYDEILSGGPPRDGIPSIDEPKFIDFGEAMDWLADTEPVIAVEFNGDARAYPLQILTWHEIVNDTVGDVPLIVTFCPLCNSAIVFDRRLNGETYEFGTSGLLRNSDLIMYDRTTESLWQQFTGEGIVGDLAGERLTFLPSSLVSFADFRVAFPEGVVLSRETGFQRSYGRNPYIGYDTIGQDPFLYLGIPDDSLAAMERVVTVSLAEADIAFPLPLLSESGVIQTTIAGQDLVVFHLAGTASALDAGQIVDGRDVGATGVFDPNLDGQKLTFVKESDGRFVDEQTNSVWNIFGQAVEGPLTGKSLTHIIHGDHFWFSWAAFKPDTVIYK